MNSEKLKRTYERVAFVFIAVAVGIATFTAGYFTKAWTTSPEMRELAFVIETIEENYVGEFDVDEFIKAAVEGTLDKYSTFYTPSEYEQVMLSRDGVSSGRMGIAFVGDSPMVVSVSGNSPAERAGIMVGDVITGVKLDGESETVKVETYRDFNGATSKIAKDIEFVIVVRRGTEEKEFSVKKEDYVESYVWYQDSLGSYNSVPANNGWTLELRETPLKSHIKEGYAYIRLSSFNGAAAVQMCAALETMKMRGIKKAVLDLRDNGGGYMDILEDIAGSLIPGKHKQLVATAEYKNGDSEGFYTRANNYDDYGFEGLTVLCNANTASASEALIGAMLDYDAKYGKNIVKVIVSDNGVKDTTFGKGIMQTTFTYKEGSAIKLTTAKIYWPVSHVCIHGKGIGEDVDERVVAVAVSNTCDAELEYALR